MRIRRSLTPRLSAYPMRRRAIPKAFVVPAPGAELTEDDVKAYVSEHVAPHKRVRIVEFVDQIPKSASGKILRRVLAEREAGGA